MRKIELLLCLSIITNVALGGRLADDFLASIQTQPNELDFFEKLFTTISQETLSTLESKKDIADSFISIHKTLNGDESQQIVSSTDNANDLNEMIRSLYFEYKELSPMKEGTPKYEEFADKIKHSCKIAFLNAYKSQNSVASNIDFQTAAKSVSASLTNIFKSLNAEMTRKVSDVDTQSKKYSQSLVTDIYLNHLKDYKTYIQSPVQKLKTAVTTLIENNDSKGFNLDNGPKSTVRIIYLVKAIQTIDNNGEEPENNDWEMYIESLIDVLDEKRNSDEFDNKYAIWNIDLIKKLLELLPFQQVFDIIERKLTDIVDTPKESAYNQMLRDAFNNGELEIKNLQNGRDILRIADFIGRNENIKLNYEQIESLRNNYGELFSLSPYAYTRKILTDIIADTYDEDGLRDLPELENLIEKSYIVRLGEDNFDGKLEGNEINQLLDEEPQTDANLLYKLVNLKKNLIDAGDDVDVNINANTPQVQELLNNTDTDFFNNNSLSHLLKLMYVYENPEQLIPLDLDISKNVEAVNGKSYNSKILKDMWDMELNYEQEPEVINIDKELPVENVEVEEMDNSSQQNLVDESQPAPRTSQVEKQEDSVVEEKSGKNLVIERLGTIDPENRKKLEEIKDFKSFNIETKYMNVDEDTDVEVTIVYIDRYESNCYNKNGPFQ